MCLLRKCRPRSMVRHRPRENLDTNHISEKTWPAAQDDNSPTARNKIQPTLSGTIPPPSKMELETKT